MHKVNPTSSSQQQTIYLIDDDKEILEAMRWLFESVQYEVKTYSQALHFLEDYKAQQTGCLITDVRLPDLSGLELLEYIKNHNFPLSVLIVTAYGDVSMAVRAMKLGAWDFILKPFNQQDLLESVQQCLQKNEQHQDFIHIHERLESLSLREQQIFEMIVEGKLNKEMAYELSLSLSTIEAHRAHIMSKMHAKNLADLIKMHWQSKIQPFNLTTPSILGKGLPF